MPACSVAVAPSATSRGLVHKAPDPVTPKGRPLERRVINAARPVCSRDWAPWGTLLGGSSGFGCRAQRRRGGGGLKLAPPRASRSVSATSCCPTVTLKRLPRRGNTPRASVPRRGRSPPNKNRDKTRAAPFAANRPYYRARRADSVARPTAAELAPTHERLAPCCSDAVPGRSLLSTAAFLSRCGAVTVEVRRLWQVLLGVLRASQLTLSTRQLPFADCTLLSSRKPSLTLIIFFSLFFFYG